MNLIRKNIIKFIRYNLYDDENLCKFIITILQKNSKIILKSNKFIFKINYQKNNKNYFYKLPFNTSDRIIKLYLIIEKNEFNYEKEKYHIKLRKEFKKPIYTRLLFNLMQKEECLIFLNILYKNNIITDEEYFTNSL